MKIFGGVAFVGMIALIIVVLASGGSSSSGSTTSSSQQSAQVEATERPIEYTNLTDFREIVQRPGELMGDHVQFQGEVITVQQTGEKIAIGNNARKGYDARLQVAVMQPDGNLGAIVVGYDGSLGNIYEGTIVRVFGTVSDTETVVLQMTGGLDLQPVVSADRIEVVE